MSVTIVRCTILSAGHHGHHGHHGAFQNDIKNTKICVLYCDNFLDVHIHDGDVGNLVCFVTSDKFWVLGWSSSHGETRACGNNTPTITVANKHEGKRKVQIQKYTNKQKHKYTNTSTDMGL